MLDSLFVKNSVIIELWDYYDIESVGNERILKYAKEC